MLRERGEGGRTTSSRGDGGDAVEVGEGEGREKDDQRLDLRMEERRELSARDDRENGGSQL